MGRRVVFVDEWRGHVRQASLQRSLVGMGGPILAGAMVYLGRPMSELILFALLAVVCNFLSEISIDIKGMRLMMAEERESDIQVADE